MFHATNSGHGRKDEREITDMGSSSTMDPTGPDSLLHRPSPTEELEEEKKGWIEKMCGMQGE
jgi:hypothetical protein